MSVGFLTRYGNPFSNVVATGVATAPITPGRTVETIRLALGGTALTKAMLTNIKIKANGKVIVDISGSNLDKLNAYRGKASDAAFIDIDFADLTMLERHDQMVSAFDTSMGIVSLTAEVTVAGATAPTLKMILIESAQQKLSKDEYAPYASVLGKIMAFPWSVASGGRLYFPHVPFGAGNGLIVKRLHVVHTGQMTGAVVKQDGLVIHESTKAENEYLQKAVGRVPQANIYTIDFCPRGVVANALNTRDAKMLEWYFDMSAADSGVVLIEALDTLANN